MVDRQYITEWTNRLGLADVWRELLQRIDTACSHGVHSDLNHPDPIKDNRQKTMPVSPEKLPDDALVVRGGRPPFDQPKPLHERCDEHQGYFGFSVQSAPGLSLDQLASALRNSIVGFTTVGEIRKIDTSR